MTLALVDTSVWARQHQPLVAQALTEAVRANEIAVTAVVILELLVAARDAREYDELAEDYGELHEIAVTPAITARARVVQAALARRGYHRGPSPVDLLTAAAAEAADAEVWHCDRAFELIGAVTEQPLRRVGT